MLKAVTADLPDMEEPPRRRTRRTRCAHCRTAWATETFTAQMCAEKRRKRVVRLCTACDFELNRIVLEFVNAPGVADKMQAYEARA